ncbi:MAG: flagellar biosynthesis anti-sigma factor FlgM [Pseudomonadales bacterium]
MVNKIDGVSGQRPPAASPSQTARTERGEADRASASGSASDQLSLTSSAQLLKELSEAVAASPEVDQGRIEAIRQAIADGSYDIDAQRIADKLLKLEDQL